MNGDNSGAPHNNFIIDRQTETVADVDISGNVMSLVSPDYAKSYDGGICETFSYLFEGCGQIVHAHELKLPATELVAECYCQMFLDCTSLKKVTMLATDVSATDCLTSWLSGVANKGEFVKAKGLELSKEELGIPAGWTVTEVEVSGN